MRRAIGLALILLFGPLPVISLWALDEAPQCQMACCKRLGKTCSLHQHAASESGASFKVVNDCAPGCSHVTAAPLLNAIAGSPPAAGFLLVSIPADFIRFVTPTVFRSNSYLHQRPPPAA